MPEIGVCPYLSDLSVAAPFERRQVMLGEIEHPLDRNPRALADGAIDEHFVTGSAFERFEQVVQAVHRHPRAVRAALAGCALAGRGRLDEGDARPALAHLAA